MDISEQRSPEQSKLNQTPMAAHVVGEPHCSPSDIGLKRHWEVCSTLVVYSGKIQIGKNSCLKKLQQYSIFPKSYFGFTFFLICTTWKIIHPALCCCCLCTPEPNPPQPLPPRHFSHLSSATIAWTWALAWAVSLIISPWIRHHWAMST